MIEKYAKHSLPLNKNDEKLVFLLLFWTVHIRIRAHIFVYTAWECSDSKKLQSCAQSIESMELYCYVFCFICLVTAYCIISIVQGKKMNIGADRMVVVLYCGLEFIFSYIICKHTIHNRHNIAFIVWMKTNLRYGKSTRASLREWTVLIRSSSRFEHENVDLRFKYLNCYYYEEIISNACFGKYSSKLFLYVN